MLGKACERGLGGVWRAPCWALLAFPGCVGSSWGSCVTVEPRPGVGGLPGSHKGETWGWSPHHPCPSRSHEAQRGEHQSPLGPSHRSWLSCPGERVAPDSTPRFSWQRGLSLLGCPPAPLCPWDMQVLPKTCRGATDTDHSRIVSRLFIARAGAGWGSQLIPGLSCPERTRLLRVRAVLGGLGHLGKAAVRRRWTAPRLSPSPSHRIHPHHPTGSIPIIP